MNKLLKLLVITALFFNVFTKQTILFATNKQRHAKIAIGTTTGICSLGVWHYLNKKIDRLEKLESILKKARGRDEATVKRIKKLIRYKYLSLFVALLSLGYIGKYVTCRFIHEYCRQNSKS